MEQLARDMTNHRAEGKRMWRPSLALKKFCLEIDDITSARTSLARAKPHDHTCALEGSIIFL